jgi:hypothetical protein
MNLSLCRTGGGGAQLTTRRTWPPIHPTTSSLALYRGGGRGWVNLLPWSS